jgi:tRNA-specific 2-thiouridylase
VSGVSGGAASAVLVAMSGGVDSSVAAALLVEAGHEVVGVTLKLWGGDSDTGCCSVSDVDDARRVAQQLGIDHLVFNFGDDFVEHVVGPYVAAHAGGTTPNPCIECNRHLKFDRLLRRAEQLGFKSVATGHHARIALDDATGVRHVTRGADRAKDQSYVVHMLDQGQLAATTFPVGHLTKAQVRAEAARLGLRTAAKPDSQDVCFITVDQGRHGFIGKRIALHAAPVVTTSGEQVGAVDAVELVTIGQRKGLGLPGGGPARYAVEVDVPGRRVVVGDDHDLQRELSEIGSLTWADDVVEGDVLVQVSAHGTPLAASAHLTPGGLVLRWVEPQRKVAPGQSVVLYDLADERVLGGGIAR